LRSNRNWKHETLRGTTTKYTQKKNFKEYFIYNVQHQSLPIKTFTRTKTDMRMDKNIIISTRQTKIKEKHKGEIPIARQISTDIRIDLFQIKFSWLH